MLTNNALVKGIKQASPLAQTSCLEGFDSVLNHFAPNMIAFSYAGMYCRCRQTLIPFYKVILVFSNIMEDHLNFYRYVLAAVHFNFNLLRDVKHQEAVGVERVKVSSPKFKYGKATV